MGGLMLGHAVVKGYEAVRAWTCVLVQWGPSQQRALAALGHVRRDFPPSLSIQVSQWLWGERVCCPGKPIEPGITVMT